MIRAPHVLVLTLLLASCGGATDRTATGERSDPPLLPTTRDSAGVTIHELPADVIERAPRIAIEPDPIMTIGGENDVDLDLSQAFGPLVLRDGGLAVFVGNTVRIYDAEGTLADVIGREGAGPQEFRSGTLAYGLGDTILVSDNSNARVAFVVPGTGVVRTRSLIFRQGDAFFAVGGQFGDDDLFLNNSGFAIRASSVQEAMTLPLGRLRRGSDSVDVLDRLSGPRFRMGPNEQLQLQDLGGWGRAALWGNTVATIDGDRWEINRLDPDGNLVGRIAAPRARTPVTEAMKEASIEGRIRLMRENMVSSPGMYGDSTTAFARARNNFFPDSLPHFNSVQSAHGATLWLGWPTMDPDSPWQYLALNPDGRVLGRVEGARPWPVALGEDRVILRTEDDNGIVTWQVHRLVMPGGGAGGVSR